MLPTSTAKAFLFMRIVSNPGKGFKMLAAHGDPLYTFPGRLQLTPFAVPYRNGVPNPSGIGIAIGIGIG
jgi:hypothetical protein